jgi:tetratricopeptide (TPR) repeat protein
MSDCVKPTAMVSRGGLVLVGLLSLLIGGGAEASAQDAGAPAAAARFREGKKHYQLSEYEDALREFKEGFRLKDDPVFLFNIAQCYRQLGDDTQALVYYRRYLATAPPAQNREETEKLILKLDSRRKVAPPPEPAAVAPPALPATLTPAPTAPAPPPSVLVGATAAPPAVSDRPAFYQRWWFWAAAGVVAGGVAVAVVLTRPARGDSCLGIPACRTLD